MSPIDDELRTALHRRATGVAPSPDPLTGIERRAGRMRRNRLAASLAGSVLAVAAVATAVPLLTRAPAPDAPPVATAPTTAPTPRPTAAPTSSYALDPAAPWAYRGAPLADLGAGTVETVRREYAVQRGVAEDAVVLTPLWGQVWEPSGQPELAFLAVVDGEARWGFAQAGEAGPELRVDEPLPEPPLALAAALPGDEVARLVVVAAPTVGALEHDADLAGEYAPLAPLAPGVGTAALEGDPRSATYRVLDPDGRVLLRADVPRVAGPDGEGAVPDQGTEAAVLVERAPDAAGDRLLVLDGDGDPERPVYRGTVAELLASS